MLQVLLVLNCGWTDLGTPKRVADTGRSLKQVRPLAAASQSATGAGYLDLASNHPASRYPRRPRRTRRQGEDSQMKCMSPRDRQEHLTAARALKMAGSPHAYVRGSTVKFYEWLRENRACKVPDGPAVWICGDCHSGNLGPIADSKGQIEIQIRDLDQTVIGNPNHDLIRLALSLASAARGSALPGVATAQMLEHMTEGYECGLRIDPNRSRVEAQRPDCIKIVMKRAMGRTWKHLARERLEDTKPTIPLGKRFWPLTREERRELIALFDLKRVRGLVTSLKGRDRDLRIEVLDAAYWMKGCSSLGRLRYAVLLGLGSKPGKHDDYCLIDIKEAMPAAAPRSNGSAMPRDNGKRVVQGAQHLAPALGERMMAARFLGQSVFLRELLPQDLKLEIDQISHEEAVGAARFLAAVLGKAHGRQMDSPTRKSFLRDLKLRRSRRLDAPSWLWSSVVDLAGIHEVAYLEHCRQYALLTRPPKARTRHGRSRRRERN